MSAAWPRRVLFPLPAICAGLILGYCGATWGANPNSQDPMLSLEIHNLTEAQNTLNAADRLFQSLWKDIQAISANPARVAGKKVSEMHVQIRQLRRAALDLQMQGETAGFDYGLRADVLAESLGRIQHVFSSTPAGQAYVQQAIVFLSTPKVAQARHAAVLNVQKLLQQKRLEEAFNVFNNVFDQVYSLTVFMDSRTADQFLIEFISVNNPATVGRNRAFRQQAQTALEQLATSRIPDTQALLQQVAAAATALQTTPQATVDGRTLTGPQCLEHFGDAWRRLHLAAVHCRAIEWARIVRISHLVDDSPAELDPKRSLDGVIGKFTEDLATNLAGLIEGDARRAAATDVPDLYVQYLQALAPLVASTSDDTLERIVQPALEKLAAKSAPFAAEVKTYQTATGELLRWRERLARAQADVAADGFRPSSEALLQFFVSDDQYRGLFAPRETVPDKAVLMASCPQIIPTAAQRGLEQPLRVADVVGLPNGRLAVARYRSRHYATLPIPDTTAESTRLRQDLMLTAQQPALTLKAMVAADSASRGDFVGVGGTVKNFHLEGLLPRFAALRPEAQQLVPLGPLPVEPSPPNYLSHVLVRFDVTPTWAHHRYFFLPLVQAAAP